ncbi:hypothetical protein KAR28_06700 [Candidatus Parcubacteria bacterium]|nr:hypothetical protein [Candidatus Parcubacteria bacterium]
MEDKELISQLNKLKEIKPSAKWQEENRSILMNQLYSLGSNLGARETAKTKLSFKWLVNLPQPAMAAFLIVMVIMGGGIMSIKAAKNSVPGQALYIAKIINEKTQQAITFDQEKKARLGLTFAHNRAKELKEVLAQEDEQAEKTERAQQLVVNFRKELAIAKERIVKINERAPKIIAEEPLNEVDANLSTDEIAVLDIEDGQMFSANLGKEENGIQIGDSEIVEEPVEEVATEPQEDTVAATEPATTTDSEQAEGQASTTEPVATEESAGAADVLEEAQALLETQDYDATLSKLEEADDLIEQAGTVKGEEAAVLATGTSAVLEIEEQASTTFENNDK